MYCYNLFILLSANILYYAINFTAAISLFKLAKRWPALMKLAEETEQSMALLKLDSRIIEKSNILAFTVIILTIGTQLIIIFLAM